MGKKDSYGAVVPLSDFVKGAITEALRAIKEAQEDGDVGALVSPAMSSEAKIDPAYGVAFHAGKMYTTMSFDLAVTAEREAHADVEGEARANFLFGVFGFGASAGGSRSKGSENRMSFAVHVELPHRPSD